jgi:hypothetical protein
VRKFVARCVANTQSFRERERFALQTRDIGTRYPYDVLPSYSGERTLYPRVVHLYKVVDVPAAKYAGHRHDNSAVLMH